MAKNRISRRNKAFERSATSNDLAFLDWKTNLEDIALGSWLYDIPKEYNGIDITDNLIDARWLEKQLLYKGSVAFFIEPVTKVPMVMNWAMSGQLDQYENPNGINVYSPYVSYSKFLNKGEYVIIWDNLDRCTTGKFLERAAYRLYDLDGTIDVNAKIQKTPAIFVTPEEKRLSNENLWMKVDGNEPIITVSKAFNIEDYKILDLSSGGKNFKGAELMDLSTMIYNRALARRGVQSAIALKRERMVENEVEQLRNFALANRRSMILSRKQAFDKIKDMFGYDIKFEFFEGFEVGSNEITGKRNEFEQLSFKEGD